MRTVTTMTWEQRCAADAQARDWAIEYGSSEFYYSAKWGQLTAIADGTTTLTDVADALTAGTATPYQDALAASYWVDGAEYLAGRARGEVAHARRGHPHEGLTDDLGQVPWLIDDDELAAAEHRHAAANAALVAAQQIRDAAEEREHDQRRGQEAEDEAAYHEAGARAARAALVAEVAGPWRTAVDVEYDQICADYGNDGHPGNDRHISAADKAAQAAAIERIAHCTGLAPGAVADAVRDVAHRYASGRSDGTDGASLGQPDWNQVADHWAQMEAEQQEHRLEREDDQVAYWGELGESHPAVREAFWDARDDLGLTAEDDIDQTELDAAYTAAGDAITATAGLPTPDPAAVIQARARSAEDDAYLACGRPTTELRAQVQADMWGDPDPTLTGDQARQFPGADPSAASSPVGPDPWRPPAADPVSGAADDDQPTSFYREDGRFDQFAYWSAQTADPDPVIADAARVALTALHTIRASQPDTIAVTATGVERHAAEPREVTSRLYGADADAWGAAEGTPVAELPASYHDWVVEGRVTEHSPGQPRAVDAVTAPHDAPQAERPPADEQASSPQDSAPATNRPESSAAGSDGRDSAAGPGPGEDTLQRARHALARLDASRQPPTERAQTPAGWRAVQHTPTRSGSAEVDPPALGPLEPGW